MPCDEPDWSSDCVFDKSRYGFVWKLWASTLHQHRLNVDRVAVKILIVSHRSCDVVYVMLCQEQVICKAGQNPVPH